MMNNPPRSPAPLSPGRFRDPPPLPDEDDLFLGWESANPALQIERWVQDTQLRPLESC
jgi:hypothetical protein